MKNKHNRIQLVRMLKQLERVTGVVLVRVVFLIRGTIMANSYNGEQVVQL